jgi:hypothetical protein
MDPLEFRREPSGGRLGYGELLHPVHDDSYVVAAQMLLDQLVAVEPSLTADMKSAFDQIRSISLLQPDDVVPFFLHWHNLGRLPDWVAESGEITVMRAHGLDKQGKQFSLDRILLPELAIRDMLLSEEGQSLRLMLESQLPSTGGFDCEEATIRITQDKPSHDMGYAVGQH